MIEVHIDDAKALAVFERTKLDARRVFKDTVTSLAIQLQRHVKEKKLSGPTRSARAKGAAMGVGKYQGQVLGVMTGRLRRSITHKVTESVVGVEGVVGTNVEYAAIHEYGWEGVQTVKEHLRKTKSGNTATVRAHARSVKLPERSFLRSALREMRPTIDRAFRDAAARLTR